MQSERSSMKRMRTLRNKRKHSGTPRYRRVKKSDLGKSWAKEQ